MHLPAKNEAKIDRREGKRVYTRNTLGGEIAQLVEQWTENPCVIGSIPILATTFFCPEAIPGGRILVSLSDSGWSRTSP